MIQANFSAYAKYVTDSLYQWDIDQVLKVTGLNLTVAPEVHFSNANMDRAIVKQAELKNQVVTVNIPNSLLQEPLRIYAHVGVYEGATFKTVEVVEIPVIARKRPFDYQITDSDEELYSFKSLENALKNKVDNTDAEALGKRIDNIVANANSTEGNSELVDVRVGADGIVYTSAGEAVREQGRRLENPTVNPGSFGLPVLAFVKDIGRTDNYYISEDGTIHNNGSYSYSDFIPVQGGQKYWLRYAYQISGAFYDSDKEFLGTLEHEGSGIVENEVFTTPNAARYIRINSNDQHLSKQCVGIGSTPLTDAEIESCAKKAYVPYVVNSKWIGKQFITLGDSITWQDGKEYEAGDEAGKVATGYQAYMAALCGFASYKNYGVSGRPVANGTANGDGTNTTAKTVDYSSFDLCVIAGGTNDFKLNVPLGEMGAIGDTSFDTTTFIGAYREMVEYILTEKPTLRICLFTPLQRANGGYDVNTTNTAGYKLIDYVNAVKAIGEMYGIPVCDMYANSGFTKLTLSTFTRDGLHPNEAGYERMGDYASRFVDAI